MWPFKKKQEVKQEPPRPEGYFERYRFFIAEVRCKIIIIRWKWFHVAPSSWWKSSAELNFDGIPTEAPYNYDSVEAAKKRLEETNGFEKANLYRETPWP